MINTYRATGAVAMADTFSIGRDFKLLSIRIHLSAVGIAGNLTCALNSIAGSAYDFNIITADMTLVDDFVWTPDGELLFAAGDELDFAWANASSRTYGLEVKYEIL